MASRLNRDDWVHLAPQRRGSVRVNHNSQACAGDSKSLLITRNDKGDLSAYCFRCNASGFVSATPHFRHPGRQDEEDEQPADQDRDGFRLPGDAVPSYPAHVQGWLNKSGVTAEQAEAWGFLWTDVGLKSGDRTVVPPSSLLIPVVKEIHAIGPEAAGYVLRGFDPKSYLTLTHAKAGFWALIRGLPEHSGRGGTLTVVEDAISARKVASVAGDALALLGTTLRPEAMQFILRQGYKEAVIFLDGDNPQVRMTTRKLRRALSFIPTRIVETGTDPKREPNERLRSLIQPIDLLDSSRYTDVTELLT
jgi:hypothetical protein